MFIVASFLMIWRLEAMNAGGVEGTVLGTLVMPYCSGMGNLIFAFIIGAKGAPGSAVVTNSLVNNITNLTLLIGLPTIFWSMSVSPEPKEGLKGKKKAKVVQQHHMNRLAMLLTLMAVMFFTSVFWVTGRDGKIDGNEGLVLVGLFLFWQCFHLYEVLKKKVSQNQRFSWKLLVDLALLGVGTYFIYVSTEWLVNWLSNIHVGFISDKHMGWLSGWLMVVPNGLLAFYYAWRGNPEVVYTSQVGDGHICIPLCVGISALYRAVEVPPEFQSGVWILWLATIIHFGFVAALGRLPRVMGVVLVLIYVLYLIKGL